MNETSTLIVYDLRDPQQWEKARRDRQAWGRRMSEIHTLASDHVVIQFRADEALEASA